MRARPARRASARSRGPGSTRRAATAGLNTMCGTRPSAHCARRAATPARAAAVAGRHVRAADRDERGVPAPLVRVEPARRDGVPALPVAEQHRDRLRRSSTDASRSHVPLAPVIRRPAAMRPLRAPTRSRRTPRRAGAAASAGSAGDSRHSSGEVAGVADARERGERRRSSRGGRRRAGAGWSRETWTWPSRSRRRDQRGRRVGLLDVHVVGVGDHTDAVQAGGAASSTACSSRLTMWSSYRLSGSSRIVTPSRCGVLAQLGERVEQHRAVLVLVARRLERRQPAGEHPVRGRRHRRGAAELGDHRQLRRMLLDRVAAQVGVEVAEEVQHLDAHGGHDDAVAAGPAQLGQPLADAGARPGRAARWRRSRAPARRPTSPAACAPGSSCSWQVSLTMRSGCRWMASAVSGRDARGAGRKSSTTCSASARVGVEQGVGVGGQRGRDDVADQRRHVDLAGGDEREEGPVQPLLAPALRELRADAADLGRHELHPVVVELLAEPQAQPVALVEAGGDDPAADGAAADRLVQRAVGAADLDADVGAAAAGELLDPLADVVGDRVEDVRRAERGGLLAAGGDGVDGDDAARRCRSASRVASSPSTPWPKTATVSPRWTSAASTALSATAPTRAKVPASGSSPAGQHAVRRSCSTGSTTSPRWPQMPHTVGAEQASGSASGAQLDDLADLGVAPAAFG